MKYGFTGSRVGPFAAQRIALTEFVLGSGDDSAIKEWHHGCCSGSDEFSHKIAKAAMPIVDLIVLHPPINPSSEMKYAEWDYVNCLWWPRRDYLMRDRDIVNECDELVATPSGPEKFRGSGTWYTIRYAIKSGKKVNIIWPDGSFESK